MRYVTSQPQLSYIKTSSSIGFRLSSWGYNDVQLMDPNQAQPMVIATVISTNSELLRNTKRVNCYVVFRSLFVITARFEHFFTLYRFLFLFWCISTSMTTYIYWECVLLLLCVLFEMKWSFINKRPIKRRLPVIRRELIISGSLISSISTIVHRPQLII